MSNASNNIATKYSTSIEAIEGHFLHRAFHFISLNLTERLFDYTQRDANGELNS